MVDVLGATRFFLSALTAALAAAFAATLHAEEPVIVSRRGASVRGTLDGALRVVDQGILQVETGGLITGSVVLPLDTKFNGADKKSSVAVDNQAGPTAVRGSISAIPGIELPKVMPPVRPVKSASLVLQANSKAPASLANFGHVTLRQAQARIALPPGSYGQLIVEQGTVVLGVAGSATAVRYELAMWDLQPGAKIEVVGPVMVTLASGGTWRGKIGEPSAPLWLDVRVAQGSVGLGPGMDFNGVLTAPNSTVTVANGAKLKGGLLCDQVTIEKGGAVTALLPNWSETAPDKDRPRFAHQALRLHSAVGQLQTNFRQVYSAGVSYIDDVPTLMLGAGYRPVADEPAALFQACRALFVDTGFERGVVTLVSKGRTSTAPMNVRNYALTRRMFEAEVNAIAGKGSLALNLLSLTQSRRLQMEFKKRVADDARVPALAP